MAVKREERVHLTRPAVRGSAAPSSGDHVGQVAEVGAPARWSARAPGRTVEIVEFRPEQARHPAVVLVHGAYADGSSWSEVIERLQGAGVPVTAVQNPLTSLAGRMGATAIEIDSGHLSLITHPQEVTQLIMNAVDAARRLT